MEKKYKFRCWYHSAPPSNFSFQVEAGTFAEAIRKSIPIAEEEGFELKHLYQVRRDDGKVYLKDDLKKIIEAITKEILES